MDWTGLDWTRTGTVTAYVAGVATFVVTSLESDLVHVTAVASGELKL